MFKRFKKGLKRTIIFFLILAVIATIVMTIVNMRSFFSKSETLDIIIDTDTGNDMDDLFALVRALTAPELNVRGILSSQWQTHPDAPRSSVGASQELNDSILKLMGITGIPTYRGAEDKLSYWSLPKPQPSRASEFIIREAHKMNQDKKLNIVTLGAMTNLATAVMIDPSIASKIRVYSMGARYDSKSGVWNKNEFNIRNDLDAFDYLLNTPSLEMQMMTATTAEIFNFPKENIFRIMKGKGGVWDFLTAKWENQFPESSEWIMYDLALIEALINPQYTKTQKVLTPPENFRKHVVVYTYINKTQMMYAFEEEIEKEISQELKPKN